MNTPHLPDTPDPVLDAGADLPAPRTRAELPSLPEIVARVRALAASLDCAVEQDVCDLAGVKPSTLEAWRKRHEGPDYIIVGNRVLYPLDGLKAFVQGRRRTRRQVAARGLL